MWRPADIIIVFIDIVVFIDLMSFLSDGQTCRVCVEPIEVSFA